MGFLTKGNSLKMKSNLFISALLSVVWVFFGSNLVAQDKTYGDENAYVLVTYNVENLFDNDGIAIFDDYKKVDKEGNTQYGWMDVLNKAQNIAKVVKFAKNGQGPDILVVNELEADHTDAEQDLVPNLETWNKFFSGRRLAELLEQDVPLSSVQILWLALKEAGMDYELAVGVPAPRMGKPSSVQMNAIFSRLPMDKALVQTHPTERARAVLEATFTVDGESFVVLANHWKSGASSADDEVIRAQNASVVRARVDELLSENPSLDIIVTGDLNVSYNQHLNMKGKVQNVSLSDVLKVNGIEASSEYLYNLWHELPYEDRGSDTYRGNWGTLMHIILNDAWYDSKGFQYIDQSFGVLAIPGLNQREHSKEPIRWSSYADGYGFSDHFPVYFSFQKANTAFVEKQPKSKDNVFEMQRGKNVKVVYSMPKEIHPFAESKLTDEAIGQYFRLPIASFSEDFKSFGTQDISIYFQNSNVRKKAQKMQSDNSLMEVIGRFDTYRGNTQFVIEDYYALIGR
jgi:endonuclease/exonuclease/phosphatase family metal-dependent hydrolase